MRRHAACAEGTVDVQSINEIPILVAAAPDLRVRLQERLRPADVNLGHDDTRNDARDRPDIRSIRQDFQQICGEHGLIQCRRGIEQRGLGSHDDALFDGTDLQPQVHTRRDVGVHRDAALLGGSESLHFRSDGVDARHQPQELKRTSLVGNRHLIRADASLPRGKRHGCAWKRRSGRIGDIAADCTCSLRHRLVRSGQTQCRQQRHARASNKAHIWSPDTLRRTSPAARSNDLCVCGLYNRRGARSSTANRRRLISIRAPGSAALWWGGRSR